MARIWANYFTSFAVSGSCGAAFAYVIAGLGTSAKCRIVHLRVVACRAAIGQDRGGPGRGGQDRMDHDAVPDRIRLLNDNGPGQVSRAFRDSPGMVGIKQVLN